MGISLNFFSVFAQTGIELGFRVLPQSTWLYNTNDYDAKIMVTDFLSSPKWAYGLNGGINFSDKFGLQSGIMLSPQGQSYLICSDTLVTCSNFEKRLSYFKVPVLLKFMTSSRNSLSLIHTIGLQYHRLIEAKHYDNGILINPPDSLSYQTIDLYTDKGWDISTSLGLLINTNEHMNIGIQLHIDYSLQDLENKDFVLNPLSTPNYYPNNRTALHYFTAGIQFEINYIIGN